MHYPEASRTYPDPTIPTMRNRPMTTHEALVEARLDEKRSIAIDALNASRARLPETTMSDRSVVERSTADGTASLRVRLGHGLVVLGSAIAGDDGSEHTRRAA
jgi:hypothetical protein